MYYRCVIVCRMLIEVNEQIHRIKVKFKFRALLYLKKYSMAWSFFVCKISLFHLYIVVAL